MKTLHVHLLPDLIADGELAGKTAVVIDCLRATSTIATALAAGAREVIPCLEVDEARKRAAEFPHGSVVLGGERDGIRIEGFDFGNSPSEYTPETVGGRTIVFTTTNGTRAMMRCRDSRRIVIAALVNRRAVVELLKDETEIHIVCAGTRGKITREDALTAGAIASPLTKSGSDWQWNDEATLAIDTWQAAQCQGLIAALHASQGGRNLVKEGFKNDITLCAKLDTIELAPQLDVSTWTIR
jgi:2-phosphosulfolactate phosphatase